VSAPEIPIRGVGFLNPVSGDQFKVIAFPGAWLIHLKIVGDVLALVIVTPSGRDTPELWTGAQFDQHRDGIFYVVVPAAAKATGPISTPEYLSHLLKNRSHPELAAIEAKRIDKSSLPPCRAEAARD
jgi:hypothetical protein